MIMLFNEQFNYVNSLRDYCLMEIIEVGEL